MSSPMKKFQEANRSRWEVLVDIPAWEEDRILNWIRGVTHHEVIGSFGSTAVQYNEYVLESIQRRYRFLFSELGVDISGWGSLLVTLRKLIKNAPELFVIVLDSLVMYVRDNTDGNGDVEFNKSKYSADFILGILSASLENGSKWRVVEQVRAETGLEERASEEITAIAKLLGNKDLTDAWNYAFGTKPDGKLAIEKAQNAVEYYATKAGFTSSKSGVYGTVLGDIKSHPEKYESAAVEQYAEIDNSLKNTLPEGTLNNMMAGWMWQSMELIQKINVIRHKHFEKDGYVIPTNAARQAVLMATLICEFIEKGYFKKGNHRSPDAKKAVVAPKLGIK